MSKITAQGMQAASDALKELGNKLAKKIIRTGLRAGCKVWLPKAKAEAPKLSGLLASKLKIRSAGSNAKRTAMSVGVGDKDFTGKEFYAGFVMYGHKIGKRATKSSTTRQAIAAGARKSVKANNFLDRVFQANARNAMDAVQESWKEQIADATAKGGK
jgi:hypothetical protein